MKLHLLFLLAAVASALPQPADDIRSVNEFAPRRRFDWSNAYDGIHDLFRRKGGGGKGGKGGSSSSDSSSSSGSGSSSDSGSSSGSSGSSGSGSSSGSRGSRPAGSSTSSSGGKTSGGTGVTPSYGGGRYYAGGASVPYTSGRRTPSGIAPLALLGVGSLAFFPGVWSYGAYLYPYSRPYTFYNTTADKNETKPVNCLCQEYQVCGCDDNSSNSTFLDSLVGNGSYSTANSTLAVADYNGTSTIFINGTLANGTTASNDSSDSADSESSPAISLQQNLMQISGYWIMVAVVGATVMIS